jgi:GMP synthase (glutamine-hydrolysing)
MSSGDDRTAPRAPTDPEGWGADAIRSVTAIRHVAFEDLGLIEPLLAERGAGVRMLDAGVDDLGGAAVLDADLLIVLGGPIGVYDEADYPFLAREIAAVERRLTANRPTLGICLGAQIMARALGARVYPNSVKEIGWGPVELTAAGRVSALARLDGIPVLHWHGDTFDLPAGASHLASTKVCRHQAFAAGPAGLALQFHIEATAQGLERWFIGHTGELASTPGVSVASLRRDTAAAAPALLRHGRACIGAWLESLAPT